MKSYQVLWLGSVRDEFRGIIDRLRNAPIELSHGDAIDRVLDSPAPDVAVVAFARPSSRMVAQMAALQTAWPTTQLICVLGGWCCGEKRLTEFGDIPCHYVHEGSEFIARRILPSRHELAEKPGIGQLVGIISPIVSFREALRDALTLSEAKTVAGTSENPPDVHGVDLLLWDAPGSPTERGHEWSLLREAFPTARVMAITTYPRPDDVVWYQSRGIEVIAQPFELSQLLRLTKDKSREAITAAA